MSKFKEGDAIVVISDGDAQSEKTIGRSGIIVESDIHGKYRHLVDFGFPIFEVRDIYGLTQSSRTRRFSDDEIAYDKSKIVHDILNDL